MTAQHSTVPSVGDTAFVAVTVATFWARPGQNRPGIEDPSIGRPVDLEEWNRRLGVPERGWHLGQTETQAVLGTPVIVDEIQGEWAKAVVTDQGFPGDERGYPGWVPLVQLDADPAFARALVDAEEIATVTAPTSRLSSTPDGTGDGIPVSFTTRLPVLGRDGDSVQVAVPGEAAPQYLPSADVVIHAPDAPAVAPTVDAFIADAERFLGLHYLWAGVSGYGMDCSGYVYALSRLHGIALPRDAGPQRDHSGLPEVAREDLQRGDLIFFYEEGSREDIRHIGIWLGDDEAGPDTMIHAPNYTRAVEKVSLEAYDVRDEYAGARRLPLMR